MNPDENHRRIQELRWLGFQRILAGIVIIGGIGVLCYIFFGEDADLHSDSDSSATGSYLRGRGLAAMLLVGVFGLWSIARGVIYLIRAQSGNDRYAKGIEDTMDGFERKLDKRLGHQTGNASMRNVVILLGCVFLCLAVVGGIVIGYLFLMRAR